MTDRTKRMEALARLAAPGSGATDPERDTARRILERMRMEGKPENRSGGMADFLQPSIRVVEVGAVDFGIGFNFHYTEDPWPWMGFDPAANVKVGVCGQDVIFTHFPQIFGFAELNQYDPMRNMDLSVREARIWEEKIRCLHALNMTKITGPCPDCESVVSFAVDDEMYGKVERVWTPLARVALLRHFARLVCTRCKEEAEKERKEVGNG